MHDIRCHTQQLQHSPAHISQQKCQLYILITFKGFKTADTVLAEFKVHQMLHNEDAQTARLLLKHINGISILHVKLRWSVRLIDRLAIKTESHRTHLHALCS